MTIQLMRIEIENLDTEEKVKFKTAHDALTYMKELPTNQQHDVLAVIAFLVDGVVVVSKFDDTEALIEELEFNCI